MSNLETDRNININAKSTTDLFRAGIQISGWVINVQGRHLYKCMFDQYILDLHLLPITNKILYNIVCTLLVVLFIDDDLERADSFLRIFEQFQSNFHICNV